MKIAVADLRPNPFRQLERFPTSRKKIDALKASIHETGFWDNLIGRPYPQGKGYQLAYGHNRLEVLKEIGTKEIDIPIRDIDDTTMAKMMAHENRVEWAGSASIEQETVRSIIEAFAAGKIKLPKVKIGRDSVREAPSFLVGPSKSSRQDLHYNAPTLAEFLQWPQPRVEAALNALSAIEEGLINDHDLEGLGAYQAATVAREVRRVMDEYPSDLDLAKAVGKSLAEGMRTSTGEPGRGGHHERGSQEVTLRNARWHADNVVAKIKRKPKPVFYPEAGKAIPQFSIKIRDKIMSPSMVEKVEQVIAVRHELDGKDVAMLAAALRTVAARCGELADRLAGKANRKLKAISNG